MHQEKRFIVDVLFVLALFGLFAVSALMLVTVGADVYKHTVDDMSANYETRVSVSYIAEKIRQNDCASIPDNGSISITSLGDTPALAMQQEFYDERYITYLYFHEGYLKELLVKEGSYTGDNSLSAGQKIMELSSFSTSMVWDNLLKIDLTTADGTQQELYIHLHAS